MATSRWTLEQLMLAFRLYCQLPFGKFHRRNKEIIELAELIGRTPSAVALKLSNFASLDPALAARGVIGMGNTSTLDRQIWDEFHADWESLATQSTHLYQALSAEKICHLPPDPEPPELADFTGETRQVMIEQRIKQAFFRRAVLSSYRGQCCMSGLAEPKLLVASHIVPWAQDKANRLNPANGLSLSAIHDRAFDQGLITLSDDYSVILSTTLLQSEDPFVIEVFIPLASKQIQMPERFLPDLDCIRRHRTEVFTDAIR
jgi:hypothetical protein